MSKQRIIHGDAAEVMKTIADESIDSIVSDPPAGISFMGRAWDGDKGGKAQWIDWLAGILREAFRVLKPGGHMFLWALPRTSHWTAEAGERAGFELREIVVHCFGSGFPKSLDVSKAIEAQVLTGGSAPSNLADAVDATGQGAPAKPNSRGIKWNDGDGTRQGVPRHAPGNWTPTTDSARRWLGFGTALKPANEHWILFRKPLEGTVASNVLRHGTGALNIDATRVASAGPIASHHGTGHGFTVGSERPYRPGDAGRFMQTIGRWPSNLTLSHTAWEETRCPCGAVCSFVARFCPECGSGEVTHHRCGCRAVGERRVKGSQLDHVCTGGEILNRGTAHKTGHTDPDGLETVTAWECLATCVCGLSVLAPEGGAAPRCKCGRGMTWACAVARLDEQSGESASVAGVPRGAASGAGWGMTATGAEYDDQGGVSRFFNTFAPPADIEPFFYIAKPSTAETEAGCEHLPGKRAHENVDREEGSAGMKSPRAGAGRTSGRKNHHPTRKGLDHMRHYVRLITPPGGRGLDMFAGSGTTICAYALEGFDAVGIEQDAEFVAIGEARLAFWAPLAGTQIAAGGTPTPKRAPEATGQRSLFDMLPATSR